jgi:NADPH:quinone reductase-like Zn-dependent oxidoreductase
MQRIEYDRYGGPEQMHLRTFSPAQPRGREVRVRVVAGAVNPFDWKLREGELKLFTGSKFPRAMGSDFAGVVESVGSQVERFKVGDEVVGTTSPKASGAFAQAVVTHEKLLVKKPAALSYVDAAVLPIPGVTAWLALVEKAKVGPGQRVFINGALGSVGRAAIAIATHRGALVAGRVGAGDLAEARACGLSPALDYKKGIPPEFSRSFDVVFDCNGSLTPREGDQLCKRGGMVIDTNLTKVKLWRAILSRQRKLVFFNGKANTLEKVVALAAAGHLALPIGITVELADAVPLIAALERGERHKGKAVITFA